VAKICNNLLLGISMIGTAEAMNLGASLGIDPKVLAGIINTSSGRCWSSDTYNPYPGVMDNAPAARGYSGGFGTDLMLKDLGLAADAAKQAKQPVPMGAMAQQLYQLWSSHGAGRQDFSSIINLLKKPA
jgi:3-hydroxyisobutyrate dehydrogenase